MLRLQTWKAEGNCTVRGSGGALYRAVWRMRRGRDAQTWLRRTSQRKRWLRHHGDEWRLVAAGGNLNAAARVLRLLAGGAQGEAQRRARQERCRPVVCAGCH
eukprot:25703-Lingulodinium_polyedra.AAC.1